MNRRLFIALFLSTFSLVAQQADFVKITETVEIANLKISLADVTVKNKKTYAYILFDFLPYADIVKKQAENQSKDLAEFRIELALKIINTLVPKRYPKLNNYKIDIVEFPTRDEYGLPKWEDVRQLEHLEGMLNISNTTKDKNSKKLKGRTR